MRSKVVLILISICLLTIISGCWDIKDVNNTAFAITIGIDKPVNPEAKYLVTLEFAKPTGGQSGPGPQSLVTSAEADSILQAIQSIQTDISRTISLSHLRAVVIGEEIAKEKDFKDFTNYLMREPQVALRLRLIFVQGASARDLFYTKHNFEQLVGAEIVALGQSQENLSFVRTNNFLDFIRNLHNTKGTAFGSRVRIKEENSFTRDGAAIYKKWKLVAWLSPQEAQNANWLVKDAQPVVVAKEGENTYTYRVSNWSRKIIPVVKNGELSFQVKINTSGMVMEEEGKEVDFSKPENLKKIELLFPKSIKQQVISAIDKSQNDLMADYLGFGKAFKQYYPEAFKSLKWDEVYPIIPVEVEVTCRVKGYGLRS